MQKIVSMIVAILVSIGCSESTVKDGSILSADSSDEQSQDTRVDQADHDCRIFLKHAWTDNRDENISVAVAIPAPAVKQVSSVKLRVRINSGKWNEVRLQESSETTNLQIYSALVPLQTAATRQLSVDFIAFLESTDGNRIFDHNWHSVNTGHLTLNTGNHWFIHEPARHCWQKFAPVGEDDASLVTNLERIDQGAKEIR